MRSEAAAGYTHDVLSVVLPLRCSAASAYRIARLEAILRFFSGDADFECVVADSGSDGDVIERVRTVCASYGRCRLVEDPTPDEPFAPGRTRNLGALHARGDHLLFYDVDLHAEPPLLGAIKAWVASAAARDFLIIPCLYLSEEGTRRVEAGWPLSEAHRSFLEGDNAWVAHLAVSTSTIVVERRHFLRVGGNREAYRGHGCEDFDLLHRLSSYQPTGKRPEDYYVDHKVPFVGDYRGFRAYFAVRALPRLFEGIYTAHLWHPRPLMRPYFRARQTNEALLQQMMRAHDAGTALPALTDDVDDVLPSPWSDEGAATAPPIGEFIRAQLEAHSLAAETCVGLFRWRPDVVRRSGTLLTKVRKLILQPREFLHDSRLPWLRWLGERLDR